MSPIRYTPVHADALSVESDGTLVRHADYAKLEAERDALLKEVIRQEAWIKRNLVKGGWNTHRSPEVFEVLKSARTPKDTHNE